ncbi:MAG: tetratricopeptide repeat protein [Chitinophagales bacterium]|nr:tetratricopeptide repeat protein [Chitinophagales bacterium]
MSKKQQKLQRRLEQQQPIKQVSTKPKASPAAPLTADEKRIINVQAIIVVLLAIGLYANTWFNEYAVDDTIVITKNEFTQQGIEGIDEIMTTDAFKGFFGNNFGFVAGGRYRPLSIVTFAIEQEIFGGNPHISHLINVLLYALTCFVIFKLLQEIFGHPKLSQFYLSVPFIATLIYTAHPIHTEVVANIKGRDEIMGMLGSVTALYLSLLYVKRQDTKLLIAAAFSFIIALFSKENAITYLAVIPLTLYFFTKPTTKDYLSTTIPMLAIAVIFVFLRSQFTPVSIDSNSNEILNNPFVRATNNERFATIAFTFWEYLRLMIFPHPLTYDYYFNQVPIIGWDSPKALLPALLNIGIIGVALYYFKQKSHISWAILYYFITISIVSNILFTVGIAMNERFVFMPSLGFAVILAILIVKATNYIKEKQWTYRMVNNPAPVLAIMAVILSGYTIKTVTRNTDWKNDFVLFSKDAVNSPNSCKTANAYAGELVSAADTTKSPEQAKAYLVEAEKQLERALRIYPTYQNALLLMGNCKYKLYKDPEQAKPYYEATLQQNPNYFEGNFNMGTIYLEAGTKNPKNYILAVPYLQRAYQEALNSGKKSQLPGARNNLADAYAQAMVVNPATGVPTYPYLDSAKSMYDEFFIPDLKAKIQNDPKKVDNYFNLGEIYIKLKDANQAIATFNQILAIEPNNAMATYKIGATYGRLLNDLDNSIAWLKKAIALDPKPEVFREDLGVAYGFKQDYQNAIQTGLDGIAINPKYAPFYYNVGVSYRMLGQTDKAQEYFAKAAQLEPGKYNQQPVPTQQQNQQNQGAAPVFKPKL